MAFGVMEGGKKETGPFGLILILLGFFFLLLLLVNANKHNDAMAKK